MRILLVSILLCVGCQGADMSGTMETITIASIPESGKSRPSCPDPTNFHDMSCRPQESDKKGDPCANRKTPEGYDRCRDLTEGLTKEPVGTFEDTDHDDQ